MNYIIEGACLSVIGNVRKNNEDNFLFDYINLDKNNNGSEQIYTLNFKNIDNKVFSVFDGMGGEANGEEASFIAANALKEYSSLSNGNINWKTYIENTNEKICKAMFQRKRMGTTVAGVSFNNEYIEICNLGDSRIYSFYNGNLKQESEDHNENKIQEKLNMSNNRKGALTQYLGIKKDEMIIQPFIKNLYYENIEKLLICSDGITDMLSNNEIENVLKENISAEKCVGMLVTAALEHGGVDNTTIMVFNISKKSEAENKINDNKNENFLNKLFNTVIGKIMK